MKKFLLILITSFVATSASYAQPSQAKAVIADKIVAVVGDKIILKRDLDNSIIDMQRQNITIP